MDENKEVVSPKARSLIYLGTLVVTSVTLLVTGGLNIAGLMDSTQMAQIMGLVGTVSAYLSGGLGTAYRPYK